MNEIHSHRRWEWASERARTKCNQNDTQYEYVQSPVYVMCVAVRAKLKLLRSTRVIHGASLYYNILRPFSSFPLPRLCLHVCVLCAVRFFLPVPYILARMTSGIKSENLCDLFDILFFFYSAVLLFPGSLVDCVLFICNFSLMCTLFIGTIFSYWFTLYNLEWHQVCRNSALLCVILDWITRKLIVYSK